MVSILVIYLCGFFIAKSRGGFHKKSPKFESSDVKFTNVNNGAHREEL